MLEGAEINPAFEQAPVDPEASGDDQNNSHTWTINEPDTLALMDLDKTSVDGTGSSATSNSSDSEEENLESYTELDDEFDTGAMSLGPYEESDYESEPDFDENFDFSVPEEVVTLEDHPPPPDDEDLDDIETFEGAGKVIKKGSSHFEEILRGQQEKSTGNTYFPFRDEDEFRLVHWLNELPMSKIDSFLGLRISQRNCNLSFGSASNMRDRIQQLPETRMPWKFTRVKLRSGTTSSPVYLCYRDPVAAVRSLLDRPLLKEHLEFQPTRHWKDREALNRRYSEIFSGDWAWEIQGSLPPGATLIPILLGSDKAHLTEYSGDKSAWPLYLSIGNIRARICNKPSMKCWVLIAYIPIPTFKDPKPQHTALQHRLFHQCLAIVLHSLQNAGTKGKYLRDSVGDYRHCFLRVAAYLADYPEQILINAAAYSNSPVTTAGYHDLGRSNPFPRRTKEWILGRIAQVCDEVDPDDVEAYQAAAKLVGLNAVDRPFWSELPGYRPDLVICPDNLHGLFRFWRDHILQWVQYLVKGPELDRRVAALQPIVGIRHFSNGINHLSQWTGREDRELQRVLLAVIDGASGINATVMQCLRGFHDFLYLAQYRSHSTSTLKYLDQALTLFHSLKGTFITNGARRGKKGTLKHFCIPKLSNLHMWHYHISRMGESTQFSTEITETCHQIMIKPAYKATNRRNFFVQMCAFMNRIDSLALIDEVGKWCKQREDPGSMLPQPSNFHPSSGKRQNCV
ncbi:hypothetical protein FRC14_002533 [Serendipita sp. 396]|nr:hypothetical protein FRC14_002533 [Serendipita sp. 396]KAG8782035.1 hypothetical protein FRC15_007647 [Serendipita sp. 397]KAG8866206.1 hypothetical protein FRC20_008955 [Serendipita sp. 405]